MSEPQPTFSDETSPPSDATLFFWRQSSPLDDLLLVSDAQGRVCALEFADREPRLRQMLARQFPHHVLAPAGPERSRALSLALRRYFEGEAQAVDDIQVASRGTALQQQVWAALRQIPAGQVITYGDLARQLGPLPETTASPDGATAALQRAGRWARAVGRANALNPVAIIVPCHRVIGADGRLTGYAGGLPRKHWLLLHEGAMADAWSRRLDGF